jgi:hypothetical protein
LPGEFAANDKEVSLRSAGLSKIRPFPADSVFTSADPDLSGETRKLGLPTAINRI